MNSLAQRALLQLYRLISATGLLSTRRGQAVFERAYEIYKTLLEAGPINHLASLVKPDTHVVDVGANVGFFTKRFGRWVSGTGRVIAIEPEGKNFERLVATIDRTGLRTAVDAVRAAAAERSGTLFLEINPNHPGDHKLAKAGIPVPAVTIDELLQQHRSLPVSLIKIDVQGSEERVIDGAMQTLARCHPALFIEVDEHHLKLNGSSARTLLERLTRLGYDIHRLARSGISQPLSVAECLRALNGRTSYSDFLFLPSREGRNSDTIGFQSTVSAIDGAKGARGRCLPNR